MFAFFKHILSFFSRPEPQFHICAEQAIHLATERVQELLCENGTSLTNLCQLIERSENENDLKIAFARLNDIMWKLSLFAPLTEQKGIIFQALKELKYSEKLGFYLNSALTPHEAINEYKTVVVQELAARIRKLENFNHRNKKFEDDLFATYLPRSYSRTLELEGKVKGQLEDLCQSLIPPRRKRSFSKITEGGTDESAEIHRESISGESHPTVKVIGSGRKKRRWDSSTYSG